VAIGSEDVRHIAALARLAVPESRIPELVSQLNGILSHMDALGQVDTSGVMAADGVGDAAMPLRADIGPPIPLVHPLADFAPQMRDGLLLVPRLATHGDSADDELSE
jgi:aspartyl-tRNA(Asn)/glutamyl-tRNA(Gln) amidotransferase subunit C